MTIDMEREEEQLLSTSTLTKIADRDLYALFHGLIDIFCDPRSVIDGNANIFCVCETSPQQASANNHITNEYHSFIDKFVPAIWEDKLAFVQFCNSFLCLLLREISVSNNSILDARVSSSSSSRAQIIAQDCISIRRLEMFRALAFRVITGGDKGNISFPSLKLNYLEDYDWSISTVLATDRASRVEQTIVKLTLMIAQNGSTGNAGGGGDKCSFAIWYEFTVDELRSFIDTLQQAKQAFTQAITT